MDLHCEEVTYSQCGVCVCVCMSKYEAIETRAHDGNYTWYWRVRRTFNRENLRFANCFHSLEHVYFTLYWFNVHSLVSMLPTGWVYRHLYIVQLSRCSKSISNLTISRERVQRFFHRINWLQTPHQLLFLYWIVLNFNCEITNNH